MLLKLKKRGEDNAATEYYEGVRITDPCDCNEFQIPCVDPSRRKLKPNPCAGVDP